MALFSLAQEKQQKNLLSAILRKGYDEKWCKKVLKIVRFVLKLHILKCYEMICQKCPSVPDNETHWLSNWCRKFYKSVIWEKIRNNLLEIEKLKLLKSSVLNKIKQILNKSQVDIFIEWVSVSHTAVRSNAPNGSIFTWGQGKKTGLTLVDKKQKQAYNI